jgi:large subunit ribosomal protein L14
MIQVGTFLNVVDNSGGRKVQCIKISFGYRQKYAGIGAVVLVSVKSLRTKRRATSKVRKGDIFKALIVKTKVKKSFFSGESMQFLENSVILLNRQNKVLGSRIFGSIPGIFRSSRHLRVVSLCAGLVH